MAVNVLIFGVMCCMWGHVVVLDAAVNHARERDSFPVLGNDVSKKPNMFIFRPLVNV